MQDDKHEASLEINHEKALLQLAWAIENSAGKFKLILARCNYTSLRSRLISKLQEICQVKISVLQLRESSRTLFAAIRSEFGEDLPAGLMVLGLESVGELSEMLVNANQVREEFRKHFPFPMVLWINDDVYKQLMQFAPDLESWSTSKNFAIAKDELAIYLRDVANSWFNNNLRLGEDDCLILKSELEAAQKDFFADENKDSNFDNWELEANLESLLGFIDKITKKQDAAIEHYQKALNLWQSVNNSNNSEFDLDDKLKRQGKILGENCSCYYLKAINNTDKNHLDWQATKKSVQDYLRFLEKNHHLIPDLINFNSLIIGEILRDLQEWSALKKLFNQALEIHRSENQQQDLARDYGFLAEAALGEENWQEARDYALQALSILSGLTDFESSQDTSLYELLLAKSQYHLGNKSSAILHLTRARDLGEPLEDSKLYIDILKNLQKLYFESKEYLKAFDIKQEKFSVEQQFGLRAFIGAGRLQSFKAEAVSTQHKYSEKIAPEIAASTRQLDVARLIQRIGRNDCKLIVIYGQSGVGKSSLVNAGIEPALKNKAIGVKDNLPVVMRVYTNWQEVLAKQISRNTINHVSTDAIFQQLTEIEKRNIRTVLIFDQFEEFFFVCTEPAQRREFFEFLAECLNVLSVKVILSLRVDYLHYLLECNKLPSMKIIGNDILSNNVLYELGNFTPSDAKSIIQRLTENANFALEAALVDQLVEDLAGTLGEVRPIELQIVGAQLQSENINTLAKYGLLGDKAKEELVKRYLQAVVENCGTENMQVAELLLYSLTDEKGTRPLKTRFELERDLKELLTPTTRSHNFPEFREGLNSSQLDLVLEILVKSGLTLLLPEQPDDRYQLVHDYIAGFIRQQQEPSLKVLMEELQKEREQRKAGEEKLNKFLKGALAGSIAAVFGFAGLAVTAVYQAREANKQKQQADINAVEANKQKRQADINAVEAQINSFEALFNSGKTLDASITALKVAEMVKQGKGVTTNNKILATTALRQVQEKYVVTELTTLTQHDNTVWRVAWSPDGKTLASASMDNTIKLWDATTSKPLKTLTQLGGAVIGIAWSPDSKTLASANEDKTIKLWDATTGKLLKTLTKNDSALRGVTWSPDGKTLASASSDKTIKLWDATTGKLLKTLSGHSNEVYGVTWSPDSKTLASANEDKTIKISDATTGKLLKTLSGHSNLVSGVTWSPDGKILASASYDKTVKLWDATTGKPLKTLTPHDGTVNSMTWSPDSKTLASASGENTIKLWNITTGKPLKTLTLHNNTVYDLAWSPDGKTLASANKDTTIKLWDTTTGKPLKTPTLHKQWVYNVAWSPDGKTLASASEDKTIKLWDATTGKVIQTLTQHNSAVIRVAWSPNGKTLASASLDKTIKLWDATTGKPLKTLTQDGDVFNLAWSPDSKNLASGGSDTRVKLWDATTGKPLKTLTQDVYVVYDLAWSPDGKTLAYATSNNTIELNDGTTGKILKIPTLHRDTVIGVAWSPDGKTLASASRDKTIKLWDVTTGKLLKTLTQDGGFLRSVAWSPDGKIIASGSEDKTIKLWDATTGKLLKTLSGHTDDVYDVAWSPDGKTLASVSGEKTIILWNFDFENLVKSACSRLENYLAFHPKKLAELKVCQNSSLLTRSAKVLVVQGEEEARNGNVEVAVEKFRLAKKWNPQFKFDPERKARELNEKITDNPSEFD